MNTNLLKFIAFIGFIIVCNLKDIKFIKEGLTSNKKTIILVGDSVLNNSKYVPNGNSVFDIIKKKTKNVYNFAVDNSKIKDINKQLSKISSEYNKPSTYIFLSIGGNDILNLSSQNQQNVNELFNDYLKAINNIKTKFPKSKIIALNIYHPRSTYYKMYYKSIDLWNKLLIKNKFEGYHILNIDEIIKEPSDLVQDIEPSSQGSKKIADSIFSY
jgi:lysophospholipase L1-like esterase